MATNQRLKKSLSRTKRAMRVRRRLKGTATRPRLSVVKSNKHLQAQLIDDEKGITLVGMSTCSKEFSDKNKETARKMGAKMAEAAKEKGVETVVFDRGAAKYHGLLAELAEGAREGGLKF